VKPVRVVLAGIGGYGEFYARELLAHAEEHGAQLIAVVDPVPERSRFWLALQEAGIPYYQSLEHFFITSTVDLVILSTPIHLHTPQILYSLSQGANILCEKPLCATLEQAQILAEAEQRAGKFVAVGYQWSFSRAVQALKRDVMTGVIGKPLRMKTKVLWPRHASYYQRNTWAGRIRTERGEWVLDSPAHNATAHYLHNMLYLLGDQPYTSAYPLRLQAECFRANPIENYDTAALRCSSSSGTEILFFTAHPVPVNIGPIIHYEFEKAVVEYNPMASASGGTDANFIARFRDGSLRSYGNPNPEEANKLWQSIQAVRTGDKPLCGIEAATPQVACIETLWKTNEITNFPAEKIRMDTTPEGDSLTWVEGLQEVLTVCFEKNLLPFEVGGIS
jgi:predicted dehydrogenase